MKDTYYFRCTQPQIHEKKNITAIQAELFKKLEKNIGPPTKETGIDGLFLDFKAGLRLMIPAGNFHVCISDSLTGHIFLDNNFSDICLVSAEKYAIPWQIDVWQDETHIFSHTFDPYGQNVLLHCSSMALGDTLAFLPYARTYRDTFHANVHIWVADYLQELTALLYPDLPLASPEQDMYAVFYLGAWRFGGLGGPVDGCSYPLPNIGAAITGLPKTTCIAPVKVDCPRQIDAPYVCIGVQASTPRKGWLYPQGWEIVVNELKRAGYRVLCIDRHTLSRADGYEIICPANAENMTGNFTLLDRLKLLAHAECFVGLSSGLSWLAYNVNCPVVLISGISEDYYEFPTPYRVINRLVCHGCYNTAQADFLGDGVICPYHQGTNREMECSREIAPNMVLSAIQRALNSRRQ